MTDISQLRQNHPEIFSRPLAERLRDWGLWLAFFAVFGFGLWWIDASPMRIANGLNKLGMLVVLMIPPWPGDGLLDYAQAMLETLAMAFLGTVIAAVIAVPLGFLGAK
ncbi:MAG: phosphonate ABC transporter, permease protein PhnE, partial [Hyphomicrobiales bacterium]